MDKVSGNKASDFEKDIVWFTLRVHEYKYIDKLKDVYVIKKQNTDAMRLLRWDDEFGVFSYPSVSIGNLWRYR